MSTCGEDLTRLTRLLKNSSDVSFTQTRLEQLDWDEAHPAPSANPAPVPHFQPVPVLGTPLLPAKRERYQRAVANSIDQDPFHWPLAAQPPWRSRNARQIEQALQQCCELSDSDEEERRQEAAWRARRTVAPQWSGLRRSDVWQVKKYSIQPEALPTLSYSFEGLRPEQVTMLLSRTQPRTRRKPQKKMTVSKEFPQTPSGLLKKAKKSPEKIDELLVKKAWTYIMKRDLAKGLKAMQKQRADLRNNLKRLSQLALKEVQKKANKMQREAKEAHARGRRLQREMAQFWRRRERETADVKRRRDREEQEARKKRLEEEESRMQKKRLEFLMRQSEIYSHFMAQKLGIAPVASSKVSSLTADEDQARETVKKKIMENRDRLQTFDKQVINNDDLKDLGLTGLDKVDDQQMMSRIEQAPQSFTGNLKDYQLRGLRWLDNLYEQGINGILADDMGLGKTIQTVALLAHLSCNKGVWGPFLVVCPASTLHNWDHELRHFCPSLTVLPYWGHIRDRKLQRRHLQNKKLGASDSPFHVCVTSYQLVLADEKFFHKVEWKYMILDEAHAIKNTSTQRWSTLLSFNARNKLLLTGTPIQNSMAELWALLHFIMPRLFDSHEHFQEWFSKDIEAHSHDAGAVNEHQLQRLHAILKPFMLRRVKKDVEEEIGPKQEEEITCELSHRQRILYDRIKRKLNISEFFSMTDSLTKVENLMNLVMQFRKVCNHPDLFERRPEHAPVTFIDPLMRGPQMKVSFTQLLEVRASCRNPICYTMPKLVAELCLVQRSLPRIYGPEYFWLFRCMGLSYNEGLALIYSDDLCKALLILHFAIRYKRLATYEEWTAPLFWLYKPQKKLPLVVNPPTILCGLYSPSVVAAPIRLHSSHRLTSKYIGFLHSPQLKKWLFGNQFKPSACFEAADVPRPRQLSHALVTPPRSCIDLPSVERLLQDSAKLKLLDTLLKEIRQGDHRVLIFCQMTKMLDILEEYLYYRKYSFLRLDGSTNVSDRKSLINEFQENKSIFVFVLSTRAGGLGVNLTAADTVIFYDIDWNPTVDAQATDRVHRIGQNKPVRIYKLITANTVEQRILDRAKQKQNVQTTVYAGGAFKADIFKPSEVMDLLFDEREAAGKTAYTQKFIGNLKRAKKRTKEGEEFNVAALVEKELS